MTIAADFPSGHPSFSRRQVALANPFVEFRPEATEQSVVQRFEQQVEKYGDRLAVKGASGALTYGALNQAANRVAHAIVEHGNTSPEPVAVLLEHDTPQIVAILGALKAGKFYVPLDRAQPRARLAQLLGESQARLMLAERRTVDAARALAGDEIQVVLIDDLDPGLSSMNLGLSLSPDALACILYTSGSTGRPKGIIQTHRGVLSHVMNHTNCLRTCANDRQALLAVCTYIGALRDAFSALLNGAAVLPFDLRAEGLNSLAAWMAREEITYYNSVATAFRQFASTLRPGDEFPRVRAIKLGGEAVLSGDIELVRRHFPADCVVYLAGGGTETGTALYQLITSDTPIREGVVPIGYPAPYTEVMLLDEAGLPVGPGDIGEIAVRSRYLSPGYWRNPELTEAAFRPDPAGGDARIYLTGDLGRQLPDGRYAHLGRRDWQVKIRGHRIEIAEVEHALRTLPAVGEVAVAAQQTAPGTRRLVAYVVPTPATPVTVGDLRAGLGARLPAYMIPARFVFLESLPLTTTGKVDREGLPAPGPERPETDQEYVAPRTPFETLLAGIWADLLKLDRVGIHDDFLILGGDSLVAARLVSRVRDALQIELPITELLRASTVADQAETILRLAIAATPELTNPATSDLR